MQIDATRRVPDSTTDSRIGKEGYGSGDDPKEEGKTSSGLVANKVVTEALTEF